jgi:branched-chain amino acid transport system substrate-binding protein
MRRKIMKRKPLGVVVLAIVFGVMAVTGVQAAQVIHMGLSLAITGPTSDAGNPYAKGVEDYVKYANDTKILKDAVIDCPIKDDQYKTENTKRIFEEYLDQNIVLFLSYATGANLALGKDFTEEKIPVIPASFHKGILDGSPYIFMPIASYSDQTVGLAEYVANHHKGGIPKVALFVHPSAFGRAPVADTEAAVAAGLKIEIVEVVEHGKDLDNSATLQRLQSKGVQYVICQTVQSPVATLIKDSQRLGLTAATFGEPGKITFLGAHYTGGNDLIALAGSAAEGFYWTTSYRLTTEKGPLRDFQLDLAKRYGRDEKAANSHNYTNGMMAAQLAIETVRRVMESGKEVNRANLYDTFNNMHGKNAFESITVVGPVTFSETDHMGVDTLQLYSVQGGVFKSVGEPFVSEYMKKIKK